MNARSGLNSRLLISGLLLFRFLCFRALPFPVGFPSSSVLDRSGFRLFGTPFGTQTFFLLPFRGGHSSFRPSGRSFSRSSVGRLGLGLPLPSVEYSTRDLGLRGKMWQFIHDVVIIFLATRFVPFRSARDSFLGSGSFSNFSRDKKRPLSFFVQLPPKTDSIHIA